jgi:hypothetical protein
MRLILNIVIVSALISLPRLASAQEDARRAQAEAVFAEGLKLHDANRDADALAKYRQAYAVYPTPNILFAIARLEQVLGQSLTAVVHFREALKSPILHPRNQELGKGYIAELEKKLARVILVGPAGLRVMVAGKEHRLPLDGVVDVEPGPVDARAELEGRTYIGRVETLAGTQAILELKLVQNTPGGGAATPPDGQTFVEPPSAGAEPSHATRNVVAGTLAAVGLVGLVAAVAFRVSSEGKISDAIAFRDSVAGGPCASRSLPTCERYASMLDDVQSSRYLSTALFIGGGVFLAGGAAAFFAWPKRATTAWAYPVFTGTAAGLRGNF